MYLSFLSKIDLGWQIAQTQPVLDFQLNRFNNDEIKYIITDNHKHPENINFEIINPVIQKEPTSESFKKWALKPNVDLYNQLQKIDLTGIRAGFLWCNNYTFKDYLNRNGIPVIHNESGSLRCPDWKPSNYFDFSGVNANTEFEKRCTNFIKTYKGELLSQEELIDLVALDKNLIDIFRKSKKNKGKVGIALQVCDDSNILGYANNYTNIQLVNYFIKKYGWDNCLIRNHPNARLKYVKDNHDHLSKLEFLDSIDTLCTINSSMAFEAALLGKNAEILGKSPFSFLYSLNEKDKLKSLNFAVISYLIPYGFLYDKEYYNFRLECFDETELFRAGLENWKM